MGNRGLKIRNATVSLSLASAAITVSAVFVFRHYGLMQWGHTILAALSFLLLLWSAIILAKAGLVSKTALYVSSFLVLLLSIGVLVSNAISGHGLSYETLTFLSLDSISAGFYGWARYHTGIVALSVLFCALLFIGRRFDSQWHRTGFVRVMGWSFAGLSILIHPGSMDLFDTFSTGRKTIPKTFQSYMKSSRDNLSDADFESLKQGDLPNILIIFLESFERAYLDENRFPYLAPNVAELDQSSATFSDFRPVWGAGHTIAGMVSALCGMPYATIGGKPYQHGGGNIYMPGIQCLGDVTSKLGYRNLYYQGAALSFTRKGAFYRAHGYHEIKGQNHLKPANYVSGDQATWGLHDGHLLTESLARLKQLKESEDDRPFVFTLLTLDTHDVYSTNYVSKSCLERGYGTYPHGDNPIQDAVRCTDYLIGEFVSDVRGIWGDKLDVYFVTDHLAHPPSTGELLGSVPIDERRLIFAKLAEDRTEIERPITHLDIAPTILDRITRGKITEIGMGVSAFSKKKNLRELYGIEQLNQDIRNSILNFADMVWPLPNLSENDMRVDLTAKNVEIGEHVFPVPVAFVLNENHDIIDFYTSTIHHYYMFQKESPRVIQIDTCHSIVAELATDYCLTYGNLGSEKLTTRGLTRKESVEISELKPVLDAAPALADWNRYLFDRTDGLEDGAVAFSTDSDNTDKLARIVFNVDQAGSQMMVINHDYPSVFDRSTNYKNHGAPVHNGLFLFGIDDGLVDIIASWRDCGKTRETKRAVDVMKKSGFTEFVLMSAIRGKCSKELANLFEASPFYKDIFELRKWDPFIGYYDQKNNRYVSRIGSNKKQLVFSLVDSDLYNKNYLTH